MSDAEATPGTLSETAARVRRLRRLVIVTLVLGGLGAAGWGLYRGTVAYVRRSCDSGCRAARAAKEWDRLEALALRWTWWQRDSALPWVFAAQAALERGESEQAAEYLRQSPDSDPKTLEVLLQLTDLLFGTLNQPFEAAATCERLLRIDPALGEAHRRLTFFYAVTVQRAKMVAQAREAIERDCDIPETYAYVIGAEWLTFSNGFEWNTRWLAKHRDHETLLAARAVHFVKSKALEDSTGQVEDESGAARTADYERVMNEYVARFPKNLELLNYFLTKACLTGNASRVAELLGQAPPAAIDDNRFWRYKGWLHAARRELALAEVAYRRALKLNPYDWHSQHELADVMRRLQKYDEVESLESRSMEGKALYREIVQLPDMKSIPTPLLRRMAAYAEACGDYAIATHLSWRIDTMRQGDQWNRPSSSPNG